MNHQRLIQENMHIRQTANPDGPNADFIADALNFALRVIVGHAKSQGIEKISYTGIHDMDTDDKEAMIQQLNTLTD